MLVYKALYRKMIDALKDSGMWLDWAEQLKESHPEVAKYLAESAKVRLDSDFPLSYEHFKKVCEVKQAKDGMCINEMLEEHMMEWYESLCAKVKKF